jgi:hypothetical protein
MQQGRTLDPLMIYDGGKEDGRHRAVAAKEMGIKTVPVILFGSSKALATSQKTDVPSRANGGSVSYREEPTPRKLLAGIFDTDGAISRAIRTLRRAN